MWSYHLHLDRSSSLSADSSLEEEIDGSSSRVSLTMNGFFEPFDTANSSFALPQLSDKLFFFPLKLDVVFGLVKL